MVEDDVFLKAGLLRALYVVDPNLSVRWASSFEEATEALEEGDPDLVIADCLLGSRRSGMDLGTMPQRTTSDAFSDDHRSWSENTGPTQVRG